MCLISICGKTNKLTYFIVTAPLLFLISCQEQTTLPPNSPNFLIIMADDLDYSEIGCYGGEIPTPNIDQLAKEGMLFTNFYTAKEDAKTRSMLLTGTSQALIPTTNELQKEAATIAQLLKEAGYRTAMSGKWNLGENRVDSPIEKGFDQSFALMADRCNHLGNKRYLPAIFRANNNIQEISEDFYTTQYFTRQLLSFLSTNKKQQQKPFFAYLSFSAPHYPLQAPTRNIQNFQHQYDEGYSTIYQERLANQLSLGIHTGIDDLALPNWDDLTVETQTYEAKKMEIYAAMVNEMDTYIGQVIDYLKIAKQYDNTVIIFLADGGITKMEGTNSLATLDNSLENLGNANSMVTLGNGWESIKLGNKGNQMQTDFDNAIKAPLIISSPLLKAQTGSRIDELQTVLDITPTILDIVGLPHPSDSYFEDVLVMEGKAIF